jgi:hypothetical protein
MSNPFLGMSHMGQGVQDKFSRSLMTGDSRTMAGKALGISTNQASGQAGWMGKAGNFAAGNPDAIMGGINGLVGVADALFAKPTFAKDTRGNEMATDTHGRPVMQTQNYQSGINHIKGEAKGEIGKSMGSGALSGAGMGASIGSVVPGIGTAIGAAVGGLAGGVAGLIGGSRRKKKALQEVSNREGLLNESMLDLNMDNRHFFETDMGRDIQSFQMNERARRLSR